MVFSRLKKFSALSFKEPVAFSLKTKSGAPSFLKTGEIFEL